MSRRISARGIINSGPLLFCVCLNHQGVKQNFWCTPGGGLKKGEDLLTCLERELIEELGVRPDIGNLLYIQQFKHDTDEYLDFFFNINNIQAFLEIDLSITSHAVQEIAEYGFKSPQEIDLLPLFLRQRNIEDDIIKGHTQVFSYL